MVSCTESHCRNRENLALLRVGGPFDKLRAGSANASVPTQSDFKFVPVLGIGGILGYPPPRRISGINELAGKLEIIYGVQAVAGKILSRKGLAPIQRFVPVLLPPWSGSAVPTPSR